MRPAAEEIGPPTSSHPTNLLLRLPALSAAACSLPCTRRWMAEDCIVRAASAVSAGLPKDARGDLAASVIT